MKRISIYEFREDVPKVISDLYDNSSICLYMSSDGYFFLIIVNLMFGLFVGKKKM